MYENYFNPNLSIVTWIFSRRIQPSTISDSPLITKLGLFFIGLEGAKLEWSAENYVAVFTLNNSHPAQPWRVDNFRIGNRYFLYMQCYATEKQGIVRIAV